MIGRDEKWDGDPNEKWDGDPNEKWDGDPKNVSNQICRELRWKDRWMKS